MKVLIASLLVFPAFLSEISHASAMSPERARCEAMKEIYKTQSKWRADYFRFKSDDSLSPEGRFQVSYRGAQKIVSLIEEMETLAEIKDSDPLMKDAHRLFDAIENNDVTKRSAQVVLTKGLENLADKMSDVISRAEEKTDCELSPQPICINPAAACPRIHRGKLIVPSAESSGNQ